MQTMPLLVDVAVKATVILLVAAVTALTLRRAPAAARHFVWTMALLGALAMPVLSFAMPRWPLPLVTLSPAAVPSSTAAIVSASFSSPVDSDATAIAPPMHRAVTTTVTDRRAAAPTTSPLSWPAWLMIVWAAGAMLIVGRVSLGVAIVAIMARQMPEITDAAWLPEAHVLAESLGLGRVRFLRTRAASMPMACGLIRRSVLVPADADGWPIERLRSVLLHELAHVRRRDCLTHAMSQIACAAYWFNPLAWIAVRRLRAERERACDDMVLASGMRGSDYADQLLELARVMNAVRFPVVLGGATLAMAHRSQLEGRLIAILDPSVPHRGLSRAPALVAAGTLAGLALALASIQPWVVEAAANKSLPGDKQLPALDVRAVPRPAPEAAPRLASRAVQAAAPDSHAGMAAVREGAGFGTSDAQGVGVSVGQGVGMGVGRGIGQGISEGVSEGVADGFSGQKDKDKDKGKDKDGKGAARDPRAVTALIEALKDNDPGVRQAAMSALAQVRDPRLFEPFVAALKDSNSEVRGQAVFGLGQMRDERAIEPLSGLLKDPSGEVREQAVFALGQLRAVAAIPALMAALHDTSSDVREQAAFALGQIRDRRAVEPLISALKDEKPDVRQQAAFSLGQLRDEQAVEPLIVALKDASPSVREQVAFALGQIRDPRAIDGLTAALKDASPSVRQQAAFAIGQIR